MLPKPQRLNLKKDFKRVVAGPLRQSDSEARKKLETKFLKLFIRMGDSSVDSGPKAGIAVSSKTFPKATERNRARRLVSAAFEVLYSRLPNTINIVALPKRGVIEVKSGNILLDLEEELKKAGII